MEYDTIKLNTITEFANMCLHEMNFGELSTTECISKYLDLWNKKKSKLLSALISEYESKVKQMPIEERPELNLIIRDLRNVLK